VNVTERGSAVIVYSSYFQHSRSWAAPASRDTVRENWSTKRNTYPSPTLSTNPPPAPLSLGLAWDRIRASTVQVLSRSAWVLARPCEFTFHIL